MASGSVSRTRTVALITTVRQGLSRYETRRLEDGSRWTVAGGRAAIRDRSCKWQLS